jgi:SAM-dependent methyltransferase
VTELTRHYAKLCDPRDFADPEFLRMAADILPERDSATQRERKVWEFAMLALFLEDVGALQDEATALGVGAGDERMVFWLANHMGTVVATDVYGTGRFSEREAVPSMLEAPAAHAPFPYREDHLQVRWMDGRRLDFPAASFDVVFSLSSIEHFGRPRDIAAAAREIGRVLRPGGHAFVVTECVVRLHPLDRAPVGFAVRVATRGRRHHLASPRRRLGVGDAFTPQELERRIIRPSGLRLMQPLRPGVPPEAWENLTRQAPDASLHPATGEYFPHVLLTTGRSVFTSVCLPLEKPAA